MAVARRPDHASPGGQAMRGASPIPRRRGPRRSGPGTVSSTRARGLVRARADATMQVPAGRAVACATAIHVSPTPSIDGPALRSEAPARNGRARKQLHHRDVRSRRSPLHGRRAASVRRVVREDISRPRARIASSLALWAPGARCSSRRARTSWTASACSRSSPSPCAWPTRGDAASRRHDAVDVDDVVLVGGFGRSSGPTSGRLPLLWQWWRHHVTLALRSDRHRRPKRRVATALDAARRGTKPFGLLAPGEESTDRTHSTRVSSPTAALVTGGSMSSPEPENLGSLLRRGHRRRSRGTCRRGRPVAALVSRGGSGGLARPSSPR